MGKRIWLLFVIIVLTLSAGCDFNFSTTSQGTSSGPSLDELSTLSALSSQTYSAPTLELPGLPTFTANVDLNELGEGGEKPTKTPMAGSIKITAITQRSPGVAQVSWEASGDFPSGFKIVITDQQSKPIYPENTYTSVYGSTARSGVVNFNTDRIYYVRVCRFMIDSCDIYSDLGIFAFAPPTATPKPTKTPSASGGTSSTGTSGTTVPYDSTLIITLIKGGTDGKAYMAWTDKSTSAKGYKIVYSTTNSVPSLGTDSNFYVPESTARFAYVEGASNTKYYYRLCRYTGTACSSYSAVYTFTFPVYTISSTPTITSTSDSSTITISTITDTTTDVAQVNWTASGTFENGFKILYSTTNTLPTLSDNVIVVSDGAARVGTIYGDLSGTYHVRVCKYSGSSCTVYSPVVDFTFATITITDLVDNDTTVGNIDLKWTTTGTFTDGFIVLYSTTETTPTYENASILTVASDITRTATVEGTDGTLYYLRLCQFNGIGCSVYSNTVSFTTQTNGVVLTENMSTPFTYDWALPGSVADNLDGYYLFWAQDNITPIWSSGLSTQEFAPAGIRTLTLVSPPSTTGHYIMRLCVYSVASGGSCTAYSNTIARNFVGP